tara:strand:- start:4077 stop:4829 length:753 start_codon:yes stop_codon:yes gene_type:complete
MPTKRPDQLPEGSDFNLDDIVIIEKSPDSNARKLLKSTIRDFMSSANQFDPENVGSTAIVGFQSKFEWMVEQMQKIAENPAAVITPYEEFESSTKEQESQFVTPTPSKTPPLTPTPSLTPNIPLSQTPTPSASRPSPIVELTIDGPSTTRVSIPNDLLPSNRGYSNWEIKPGQFTSNLAPNFQGIFPDNFKSSGLGEALFALERLNNENALFVDTAIISNQTVFGQIVATETSQGGLIQGSSLTITLKYS